MNFKVRVLGCGDSLGVPRLGCYCNVCSSGLDKNRRTRSSVAIFFDSGWFIIDATPDLKNQLLPLKVDYNKFLGVLFSHPHADHILGIEDLRSISLSLRKELSIYASHETLIEIYSRFFYRVSYIRKKVNALPWENLNSIRINYGEVFTLDGVNIVPFFAYHGDIKVTGFRIHDFAYLPDCKILPDESRILLKNVQTLILGALWSKNKAEIMNPKHLTVEEAVELGEELKVERLYLTHLSHKVDYYEDMKMLPNWVEFCYDGLEIEQ